MGFINPNTIISGGGTEYEQAYAQWQKSHKPFHWWAEFYNIVHNGGFDVIIGNPPYVEYNKVKSAYTVKNYKTESCGNLYAFSMERGMNLLRNIGEYGLIVPISAIGLEECI